MCVCVAPEACVASISTWQDSNSLFVSWNLSTNASSSADVIVLIGSEETGSVVYNGSIGNSTRSIEIPNLPVGKYVIEVTLFTPCCSVPYKAEVDYVGGGEWVGHR